MLLLKCAFGPRLFSTYGALQKNYEPNVLETIGDRILDMLSVLYSFGSFSSPVILTFLYNRGYLVADNLSTFAKLTSSVGFLFVVSICLRAIGRKQSVQYTQFIKIYGMSRETSERTRLLEKFDFEFSYRDDNFDVRKLQGVDLKETSSADGSLTITSWRSALCDIAAYCAIHSFGIRMIYPGTIKILQKYMRPLLLAGRTKLIEQFKAKRFKIRTIDGNHIDAIFVDRRNNSMNGNMLVLCTEGNAGFYEIGIMNTPLNLNYSVLGWNHPGFESSTGTPYPSQEKNGIVAVILFAIHHLGFKTESIILYGWSIGGFGSLWAATCYPDVKGIILDATFDDLLHLAKVRMPISVSKIVEIAIRKYCNLNNIDMIYAYHGPITIIRRTEDEIIAENGLLETNRGTFLLLALLKHRYPLIFGERQENDILSLLKYPLESIKYSEANRDLNTSRMEEYISENSSGFPMYIGKNYTDNMRTDMATFLVINYLKDYKSLHCTPLPTEYFQIPWTIGCG